MSYYDGTKLLSLLDINGKKPELYMVTTNRTGGKTTWFSSFLVRKFIKKRRYSRYPRYELYETMMQLKPLRLCEICGKPYAIIRQDIYFRPCLCDTCYIWVKGEIDDRDAIEEN